MVNLDTKVIQTPTYDHWLQFTSEEIATGYFKINNDKIWDNVATELGVEYVGNTTLQSSHLVKLCYELILYLLDYEQTHNFPGIIEPLNQYPKESYKNILINKSQQVRKIQRCNQSNGNNDINQFQTCSVCGQFPDSYNVANVILECIQCGNRWHSKCHEPQIPIQQLHILLNSANGNNIPLSCTNCTIQRTAKFGYHSSGKVYSLNEYKTKADLFKSNYCKSLDRESLRESLSDTEWENVFWSVVDNGCSPISIEYGSEIPSRPEMTGFPMEQDADNDENSPISHVTHDFNLMNIKNAKGNITSSMYKCNDAKNTIIQYQYPGSECGDTFEIGADDIVYSLFYCTGSDYSHDTSHQPNNNCNMTDILQMKWYENDSCITDERYWGQSNVIMNVGWPNYNENTSAIILYHANNYTIYRYNNIDCNEPSFTSIEYQSGNCVDGNTFIIQSAISSVISCNYWMSTDGYAYPINHCYKIQSGNHICKGFKFRSVKCEYIIVCFLFCFVAISCVVCVCSFNSYMF